MTWPLELLGEDRHSPEYLARQIHEAVLKITSGAVPRYTGLHLDLFGCDEVEVARRVVPDYIPTSVTHVAPGGCRCPLAPAR